MASFSDAGAVAALPTIECRIPITTNVAITTSADGGDGEDGQAPCSGSSSEVFEVSFGVRNVFSGMGPAGGGGSGGSGRAPMVHGP